MSWRYRAAGRRCARRSERFFGTLEHARATRFHVPKNTFIVTGRLENGLKKQAQSRGACDNEARIHDLSSRFWKFQKTPCTKTRHASPTSACASLGSSATTRDGRWAIPAQHRSAAIQLKDRRWLRLAESFECQAVERRSRCRGTQLFSTTRGPISTTIFGQGWKVLGSGLQGQSSGLQGQPPHIF
jgi:hypothetical protein